MISIYKLIILSSTVFSAFSFGAVNTSESITNSRTEASTTSNAVRDMYTNSFNQKVALPMTTGTEMTSVDGSKSGVANLTCSDVATLFSQISVVGSVNPSINVKLDIDLDGSFERDLTFSDISGIHTTGVFKCMIGARACTYYNWQFSTSGGLTLEEINSSSAAGAYCINDTCSAIYVRDLPQILNDVSGTITSLIQQTTSLVVTNTSTSSTVTSIYAQNYNNCSNSSGVIYDSSNNSLPSEALLQSQASAVDPLNDANVVLSNVSVNETTNPIDPTEISDINTIPNTSTSSVSVSSSDPRDISYTMTYKDSSGNYVTSNDDSSMNFEHIEPDYCMVEWDEVYTSVTTDNNIRGVTASGLRTTKKTETRLCSGEYNNICPISASERIKYDCGNLDKSINQAAAALNTLSGIVDDMICNIGN